jgi:hypothetical protein
VLVAVVMGAFGWLVDRLLIERIRDQGEEAGILLTIGLSIFLANTALLAVGTAPLKVEAPVAKAGVPRSRRADEAAAVRGRHLRGADPRGAWLTIHKRGSAARCGPPSRTRWPRGWPAYAPPTSTQPPSRWAPSSPPWPACCSDRSTRRRCPWAAW